MLNKTKYYKLMDGAEIVGAISDYAFRAVHKELNIIVYCEAKDVEFVEYNGKFYRDTWMAPTQKSEPFFSMVKCIAIRKTEYDKLSKILA